MSSGPLQIQAFGSWLPSWTPWFYGLCPAPCWPRSFGPPLLAPLFWPPSFVRSAGSFSLLWRESEEKGSRLLGVSRSHSSNDSLCHRSSGRPRQRRHRWRMWQHLPPAQPWTEMRCHPHFGLSAGDDQQCLRLPLSPKSVSQPPPNVSSPSGRVCVILPDWHSTGSGYQLLKSRTLKVNLIFSPGRPHAHANLFLFDGENQINLFIYIATYTIKAPPVVNGELRLGHSSLSSGTVSTCKCKNLCSRRCRSMLINN